MEAPSLISLALQQILPLLLKAEVPDPSALRALVGRDLALLLLSAEPGQIRLQTPEGRVFTAQGELPFPPGTELKVRVLPDPTTGGVKLQTLEAQPPAPPSLLGPLTQGEASALMLRLELPDPPPSLAPLVELHQVLKPLDSGASPRAESPLRELPPPVMQAFAKLLGIPPNSPPAEVAATLSRWTHSQPQQDTASLQQAFEKLVARDPALSKDIREPLLKAFSQVQIPVTLEPAPSAAPVPREPGTLRSVPPNLPAPLAEAEPSTIEAEKGPALAQVISGPPSPAGAAPTLNLGGLSEPATRLLAQALGFPDLAPKAEVGRALDTWVKDLLGRSQPDLQRAFRALVARAPEGKPELRNSLLIWGERSLPNPSGTLGPESTRVLEAALGRVLEPQTQAAPSAPESWEAWLRSSTRALADPAATPGSAPFHAAQGKEGTALFEIPLPWAPQSPLQLWVEGDGEGDPTPGREPEQRVLMGLHLTHLGDTRVGLAQSSVGLRVRIWAEHPERLLAQLSVIETDLKALGRPVDLKVLTLEPGSPDLRQVAATRGLEALG